MNPNQNKSSFNIIKGLAITAVVLTIFYIGSYVGSRSVAQGQSTNIPTINGIPVTADQLAPLWKAWKVLDSRFVDHDATSTPDKRIYGAIKGLTQSYGDPYTVFFDPQEAESFKNDIAGSFEGIGMEIGLGKVATPDEGYIVVVAPLKDSPSEKAGMKIGDRIIKINDNSTVGYSVEKAVKEIRGPKGTEVSLTVVRDGAKDPLVIKITRDVINMPTIKTETRDKKGKVRETVAGKDPVKKNEQGDVKVIKLHSFNANSPEMFRKAVRDFIESGSDKLILDLRGNPGGYLDAAVYMASFFLPAGDVIVSEDFGGSRPTLVHRSAGYNVFTKNTKVIVLVNGGSASASEILAGSLQDHKVAKLLGTKTFGKGSVQEVVPITADTALKVTVAHWLTPNGKNISKQGIDPDYEVKPEAPKSTKDSKGANNSANITKSEDDSGKIDYQMDRALEIIRNEM